MSNINAKMGAKIKAAFKELFLKKKKPVNAVPVAERSS